MKQNKTLFRSDSNRIIAGVCGGIGEYFDVDPTFIRILFVLITLFGGSGIFIYFVLWILVPSRNHGGFSFHEIKEKAQNFVTNVREEKENNFTAAMIFILIGILLLLNNLHVIPWNFWDTVRRFWPVLLIVMGLQMIMKRSKIWDITAVTIGILILLGIAFYLLRGI